MMVRLHYTVCRRFGAALPPRPWREAVHCAHLRIRQLAQPKNADVRNVGTVKSGTKRTATVAVKKQRTASVTKCLVCMVTVRRRFPVPLPSRQFEIFSLCLAQTAPTLIGAGVKSTFSAWRAPRAVTHSTLIFPLGPPPQKTDLRHRTRAQTRRSGRHLELLQDLSGLRFDPSSLSSPSQLPCQSSPSTQVTPVTTPLDSMVRRMAPVWIDLMDLLVPVLPDPERSFGPSEARNHLRLRAPVSSPAHYRSSDGRPDAIFGDLKQVPAVEGGYGMRCDIDRAHRFPMSGSSALSLSPDANQTF